MTNDIKKNLFDFTDLSDLPAELAQVLTAKTNGNAAIYADIVKQGAEAGYAALDINQIIAVAMRMGMNPPKQQTVRGYLNAAVKLNLIAKPTRETYGITGDAAVATTKNDAKAEAAADAVVTAEAADDPLADL